MEYPIKFGVLTASDRCSQGIQADTSGELLQELIKTSERFKGTIKDYKILPDEQIMIQDHLKWLCDGKGCDVVITTGGTGLSSRDVTPEATKNVIERDCPGIVHALFARSLRATPLGALSRLTAGTYKSSLILNFPGSTKAVQECFEVAEPILKHALQHINEQKSLTDSAHVDMQRLSLDSPQSPLLPGLFSKVGLEAVSSRARVSEYPLLSVEEALEVVFREAVGDGNIEEREVMESFGFVAAEEVHSPHPIPPFPASIKDGYAVIAKDGKGIRKVIGNVVASSHQTLPGVSKGSCARISTGAPIPPGADAVIQVEDTELVSQQGGEEVEIIVNVAPTVGQDIRKVGSDMAEGERVLTEGILLESPEIALAASVGRRTLRVYTKPVVGVLSTGNEVADWKSETLSYGQIRDSNRPALLTLFRSQGFPTFDGGITPDEPTLLLNSLVKILKNVDVIVTSGGVSMGEKDILKKVLEIDLGFKVHFGRVFMKPGKPTCFATGRFNGTKKLVFALPGNPVSAWVTSHLYVIPTLRKLQGIPSYESVIIPVQLSRTIELDARPEYHRASLVSSGDSGGLPLAVSTGANQMSSRLSSTRGANLLLQLPSKTKDKPSVQTGETVGAIFIGTL